MSRNNAVPKETLEDSAEKPKTLTIQEEVFQRIQATTRGIRPELMTGAAAAYDINNYEGDYTAGGQLVARLVNADESRIAILKHKGYDVPSAWSSQLKDLRVGSQILMLRPRKLQEDYLKHRSQLAAQMAGAEAPHNSPAYEKVAGHIIPEASGHEQESIRMPDDVLVAD
jgi:hypothetical protein